MARKTRAVASNESNGAKEKRQFGQRQNFKRGACVLWLKENNPKVFASIIEEANRRFPVARSRSVGAKGTVDYSFLRKVKA